MQQGAWIDARDLGAHVDRVYGRGAQRMVLLIVQMLNSKGLSRLERTDRYRPDGTLIGPDIKLPLETAALVLEMMAAARVAALRTLVERTSGAPLRHVAMDELLDLMLDAGCDPPGSHPQSDGNEQGAST